MLGIVLVPFYAALCRIFHRGAVFAAARSPVAVGSMIESLLRLRHVRLLRLAPAPPASSSFAASNLAGDSRPSRVLAHSR